MIAISAQDVVTMTGAIKQAMGKHTYEPFGPDYRSQVALLEASLADLEEVLGLLEGRAAKPDVVRGPELTARLFWYAHLFAMNAHTKPIAGTFSRILEAIRSGVDKKRPDSETASLIRADMTWLTSFLHVTKALGGGNLSPTESGKDQNMISD